MTLLGYPTFSNTKVQHESGSKICGLSIVCVRMSREGTSFIATCVGKVGSRGGVDGGCWRYGFVLGQEGLLTWCGATVLEQ